MSYKSAKIVFNDPKYSDIKFVIEKETVYGHRTVLLIECPKLYDLGRAYNWFGDVSVVMDGITVTAFWEFLKFIYVGHIGDQVQLKNYNELISLAEEFNKPAMIKLIKTRLDSIDLENVAEILQVCLANEFNEIKSKALEFISDNFTNVLKTNSFLNTSVTTVKEILKTDRVQFFYTGEMIVFDAVMKYFQENPEKSKHFKDLLKSVRFTTMKGMEFVTCLEKCGHLLDDTEKLLIFTEINGGLKYNSGFPNVARLVERQVISSNDCLTILSEQSTKKYFTSRLISIPKTTSFYPMNDGTVINHVNVARPSFIEAVNILVLLKNGYDQIIARGRVENVTCPASETCSKSVKVVLFPTLQLVSFNEYELCIDYQSDKSNFDIEYYIYKKLLTMPHDVEDGLTAIHFYNLCPLVHSIGLQKIS